MSALQFIRLNCSSLILFVNVFVYRTVRWSSHSFVGPDAAVSSQLSAAAGLGAVICLWLSTWLSVGCGC